MSDCQPFELGIFTKLFQRGSLGDVLDAALGAGFRLLHFNFKSAGLPHLPSTLDEETCLDIRGVFRERGTRMIGVSATFNAIHPDPSRRAADTASACRIIEFAPALGTQLVTVCTGTRDPQDMWRYHPDNSDPAAWADLVSTLRTLLAVARSANVSLGIEPEQANVVASATLARRLLDALGTDHLRIVMDPANLVSGLSLTHQESVLAEAFDLLAPYIVIAHAKDVSESGHLAAGRGLLDYDGFFRLLSRHKLDVPVVLHDVEESDLRRARDFVMGFANKWRPAVPG